MGCGTAARAPRLGGSGPHRPGAEIGDVGVGESRIHLGERVSREPDCDGTGDVSCGGGGQVALAEVQHRGAGGGRDIRPVIDGPERSMTIGGSGEHLEGSELVGNVDGFIAQLNDVYPSRESGVDKLGKISAPRSSIGADIQLGIRNGHGNTLTADVAVVGAGIIGLSIAWQLQSAGLRVIVIDPTPAQGASFAAAGMIAPASELRLNERHLLGAMRWAAGAFRRFVEPLGEVGFAAASTLLVGIDAADRRSLDELFDLQLSLGLDVARLTPREARLREPLLSPALSAAIEVHDDRRVDPRQLTAALISRLTVVPHRATRIGPADAAITAAHIDLDNGQTVSAAEVIVATGFAAQPPRGVPAFPVRPVFGDILRLRVPPQLGSLISSTVRGSVRGSNVYLVPRADGTIVIGATERENGSAAPSAGGVLDLLRDAHALLPAVAELELLEVTTRPRPGTPDNAPLLGRLADGLIVATGFYRHGVALAPLAAEECSRLVVGEPAEWPQFSPDRFDIVTAETSPERHSS